LYHYRSVRYFADQEIIGKAYPRVSARIPQKTSVNKISDAWEKLEETLKRHGHYKSELCKIQVTQEIGELFDPDPL